MGDTTSDQRYASVRHRALGFLTRREHAVRELAFKLAQGRAGADFDKETIDQVVSDLADAGLQSDARYADMMVRHRFEQGHGPVKLRAELSRWRVDPTDAESYNTLDWYEACKRVALKRFRGEPPADFKERAKRQRYLASRGFERDHIDHALADAE